MRPYTPLVRLPRDSTSNTLIGNRCGNPHVTPVIWTEFRSSQPRPTPPPELHVYGACSPATTCTGLQHIHTGSNPACVKQLELEWTFPETHRAFLVSRPSFGPSCFAITGRPVHPLPHAHQWSPTHHSPSHTTATHAIPWLPRWYAGKGPVGITRVCSLCPARHLGVITKSHELRGTFGVWTHQPPRLHKYARFPGVCTPPTREPSKSRAKYAPRGASLLAPRLRMPVQTQLFSTVCQFLAPHSRLEAQRGVCLTV